MSDIVTRVRDGVWSLKLRRGLKLAEVWIALDGIPCEQDLWHGYVLTDVNDCEDGSARGRIRPQGSSVRRHDVTKCNHEGTKEAEEHEAEYFRGLVFQDAVSKVDRGALPEQRPRSPGFS